MNIEKNIQSIARLHGDKAEQEANKIIELSKIKGWNEEQKEEFKASYIQLFRAVDKSYKYALNNFIDQLLGVGKKDFKINGHNIRAKDQKEAEEIARELKPITAATRTYKASTED